VQPVAEGAFGSFDTLQNRYIVAAVLAVVVAAFFYSLVRTWSRRAARRRLHRGILSVGVEHLYNVLVPDGMGNSMHVDYLLLTSRGAVVIDLRDVRGNIFGGDQMTEWTVMNGASRSTFHNPQHALYDRVAAVRAIVGDMPVEGRVLFTRRGRFPKGLPRWTLMVDSLRAEFPQGDAEASQPWVTRYRETWQTLRAAASPSHLRQNRGFFAEVLQGG
jgi:hypothetical protein